LVKTTDQMDSTDPEDRKKLAAMCEHCGTWKHFKRKEVPGNRLTRGSAGQVCDNCGHDQFIGLISERTFNPERAKKETAKLLKKKAKK
jgi:hypothetical protein